MSTAPNVPLGELLQFRNEVVHPRDRPQGISTFVGLEHIERDSGVRIGMEKIQLSEMNGRRAKFRAGDIVYGYLRPYLNKVWVAEFDGICSVDQYVLIARPDVCRDYLAHFLRSPRFLQAAPIDTAPGQLPRIRSAELANTTIPLPTIDEQLRIAAILDKADALRQKRKRALALCSGLVQSIFLQMFSASVTEFPRSRLGNLTTEARIGLVRSAEELGPQFSVPYVRMDSIGRDGLLDTSDVQRTDASDKERLVYELRPGDFLFNTRNSKELVGKSAVFSGPQGMIYNNNILRMRFSDRLSPEYLDAYLRTQEGRQSLEERKSGTTSVFAIYQRALAELMIPLAPVELQQEFASKVHMIATLRELYESQNSDAQTLFASLQHGAFSGQLSEAGT